MSQEPTGTGLGLTGAGAMRSYELDWLRVLAVLVLVFFHSSEIFSSGWFHLKNDETSRIFNSISSFIHMWHMPLFFLVAGASTWFALEFRTGKVYVKERIYRLLIPLIFGIVLLIPPQSFYENVQKAGFSGTFLEFYPHFFEGIYPNGNLHCNQVVSYPLVNAFVVSAENDNIFL